MARLIVKSPYYKCGGKSSVSGYLRYIATRERVERLPDDRPPTRKQEQLIAKLSKDFPDTRMLDEYGDYREQPTKANASALISMVLESNWDSLSSMESYAGYIATRPRAERLGSHGLFGDADGVDLKEAMSELEHYTGNVWTHIISLKREDAERLGYDNARAWRNLLRAHRNDIATAMNIPSGDFRWYAAYHDEGDHPHVHMMAWSIKPGQAYLSKEGIRQIKSKLTNDIFKQEMLHLYERKSDSREELVRQSRRAMAELVRTMANGVAEHPQAERLMQELTVQLEAVKGKKSYGYLPKPLKKLVDEIVDQMERLPVVGACYQRWWELQCQVEDFYSERERRRPPLSQQKGVRQIKNAVIQETERIRLGEVTFEDDDLTAQDEPESPESESYACRVLRKIIQDEAQLLEDRDNAVEELERLAENGDASAQLLMGQLFRDGPLLIPDSQKAKHWFTQSANAGLPQAQYALGKLLLSGDQEVHDPEEGIRCLKQAAQGGSPFAAYRLGREYLQGEMVPKDPKRAAEWFTQSAEEGNQHAQYMLGKLYLLGMGVPCDQTQAVCWLTQSASQGNPYAQLLLDRQGEQRPPSVLLLVSRLLHHMSRIFQDHSLPQSRTGLYVDSKLRRKIQEKKIAMGHRPDDHEEPQSGMTMGGM